MTDLEREVVAPKLEPYYAEKLAQQKSETQKALIARQEREENGTLKRIVEETPQYGSDDDNRKPYQKARDLAAKEFNVSGRNVGELKFLEKNHPTFYAKVVAGEMKLWTAVNQVRPRKPNADPRNAQGSNDGMPRDKRDRNGIPPLPPPRPYEFLCQTLDPTPEDRKVLSNMQRSLTLNRDVQNAAYNICDHWTQEGFTDFICLLAKRANEYTVREVLKAFTQQLERLTETKIQ